MKAKNLIRISLFAVILCMITIFGVLADEQTDATALDAKIIRFDESGNLELKSIIDERYHSVKNSVTDEGVFRIDILSENVYTDAAAQPKFTLQDSEKFTFGDYSYVKIKMRTNYPYAIQFYASQDGDIIYSQISDADIKDGNWHEVELHFTDEKKGTYTGIPYKSAEGKTYSAVWVSKTEATNVSISAPFFQFKGAKGTPDGDFFAEIEYIAFFANEEDMKAYQSNDEEIVHFGAGLANNTTSKYAKLSDDGYSLRVLPNLTTANAYGKYDAELQITGFNVDLAQYPYVKVKFKTNYPNRFQIYFPYYAYLYSEFTGKSDGKWHTATLSFAAADKANDIATSITMTNNDGESWTTHQNGKNFPSSDDTFNISDIRIQLKNHDDPEAVKDCYADIAYIAFYKTKEAMLAEDTLTSDIEKVVEAVKYAEEGLTCTLHRALGEYAVENQVREAIESKYPNVSVAADAKNFTYGDGTCTVNLNIVYGTAKRTVSVTVNLEYPNELTLETLGAQIRAYTPDDKYKGDADLRFGAQLQYDEEAFNIKECGFVLSPKGEGNPGGYSFERISVKAGNTNGSMLAYTVKEDDKNVSTYFEAQDCVAEKSHNDSVGDKVFTAVVTGIRYDGADDNEYDTVVIARPYVTYTFGGRTYTYYGNAIERTVNGVKAAAEAGKANETVIGEDAKWDNN